MEDSDREGRLFALGQSVADRLDDQRRRWFADFLAAEEYDLALEMLADWLSEEQHPITATERVEAEALAREMGNHGRVMGALSLCPD